jgi:hypothetical protein
MKYSFIVVAVMLAGCETTQEIKDYNRNVSTYEICMKIASQPLASEARTTGWRQVIAERGESCAPYAAEMSIVAGRADANLQSLQQRLAAPATPAVKPTTAFLQRQYVQGTSKICIYDRLGSPVHITIPATSLCPLTQ